MTDMSGITVLIADDSDTDRLILETIVRRDGHKVVSACNGVEAVQVFIRERPDIVLLDALMPELDGFGAALKIKAEAGEDLVPIIFLTSLTDTESLVKCLEAGGDDFLSKPYNHVILQAKIKSFQRMRKTHTTMLIQRNQIKLNNEHFLQEQRVAKQVFDKITHGGCLDDKCLRYSLSPLAIFNGDVVVAARRPSGNMMVFLGDFTGHGLPAAIGAMPLGNTFYEMVSKGFSIVDILCEINGKLKDILPVGFFCCGIMADIDVRKKTMKVWNGGLPAAYIYRTSGEINQVESSHLPLGIQSRDEFNVELEVYPYTVGDRFFMWSDGVHEARNEQEEMFGDDRLLEVFEKNKHSNTVFNEVLSSIQNFVGDSEKNDDVSIVEVLLNDNIELPDPNAHSTLDVYRKSSLAEWNFCFEIKPSSFDKFNPLPLLLNVLLEVPGLRNHTGTLYTIISELYSNALEHGVLNLDSAIKDSEDGFGRYYELRKKRIENISEGFIKIYLDNHLTQDGGELRITLEDSGEGFDYEAVSNESSAKYSGRGLVLIKKLCDSVSFYDSGRRIEVAFVWAVDE